MKSSTRSEASKARQTRATGAGGRAATERKALSLPGTEWRDGNGPGAEFAQSPRKGELFVFLE